LRVLHIINDLGVGGAEMMLLRLLSATDRSRAEPAVISLLGGEVMVELVPGIEAMGIEVVTLGMGGVPSPPAVARLVRQIRRLRPDVVQTWMYHADLLGGLAARLATRAPLVWGLHNSDLDKDRARRSTRAIARGCAVLSHRLPRRIVSCSEAAARIHRELGYDADKFVVIPNGIDTGEFRPDAASYSGLRRELGVPAGTRLVGIVARWHPQKDHRNFVRAAGIVGRRHRGVDFVLAGAGCDAANAELSGWVAGTGIPERFHLLGKRRDTPRVTAALDVAATASAYGEAFPLVIGEAMSAGVPCAVTDVGDSALMVGDTGRVAPPRDAGALAGAVSAILDLTREDRLALGAAARERIRERFSLPAVAERYQALYEGLAGGRRAGRPVRR
jgi:glycosyltransferase involved in cell wall biosynthesis